MKMKVTRRKLVIGLIKRKRHAHKVLVQLAGSSIIQNLLNPPGNKPGFVRELALVRYIKQEQIGTGAIKNAPGRWKEDAE